MKECLSHSHISYRSRLSVAQTIKHGIRFRCCGLQLGRSALRIAWLNCNTTNVWYIFEAATSINRGMFLDAADLIRHSNSIQVINNCKLGFVVAKGTKHQNKSGSAVRYQDNHHTRQLPPQDNACFASHANYQIQCALSRCGT